MAVFNYDNTSYVYSNETSSNFTVERPVYYMPQEDVSDLVMFYNVAKKYYIPVMLGVGITGNTICIAGMLSHCKRGHECALFMGAKAVSDLLFLLAYFFLWVSDFGISLYHTAGWCQFLTFVNNGATFLSQWYVVCICVERFLSCICPGVHRKLCTPVKVQISIIGLALVALPVYLNLSLTTAVQSAYSLRLCRPLPNFYSALNVLTKIDVFLNILLPFIIVLLITTVNYVRGCCPHTCHAITLGCRSRRRERSPLTDNLDCVLTTVAGAVCYVHVFLWMPSNSLRIYDLIRAMATGAQRMGHRQMLFQNILMFLFFSSFAVNIFLMPWWPPFRENIIKIAKKMRALCCPACEGRDVKEAQEIEEIVALNS